MEPEQRTVLHVGCGHKTISDLTAGFRDGSWREVRFDIDPNVRPDIIGTITDMSAVQTESVDALFSSHNIEHVYTHEVPHVLSEFRRVLKPNGFAVVTCPDLQSLGEAIAAGRIDQPLYQSSEGAITPLDIIFGHIAAIEAGRSYMAHKTGFTDRTLFQHAARAGFQQVGICRRPSAFDLWMVAAKSAMPEADFAGMAQRFG